MAKNKKELYKEEKRTVLQQLADWMARDAEDGKDRFNLLTTDKVLVIIRK